MRKICMKRSMTWASVGSIVVEEVGAPVVIRGIEDEELSESDGLLNSEVVHEPTNPEIPNPEPNATILQRDCHD